MLIGRGRCVSCLLLDINKRVLCTIFFERWSSRVTKPQPSVIHRWIPVTNFCAVFSSALAWDTLFPRIVWSVTDENQIAHEWLFEVPTNQSNYTTASPSVGFYSNPYDQITSAITIPMIRLFIAWNRSAPSYGLSAYAGIRPKQKILSLMAHHVLYGTDCSPGCGPLPNWSKILSFRNKRA